MIDVRVAAFRLHLPVVVALAWDAFAQAGLRVEYTVVRSSGHQRELGESRGVDLLHTALDNVASWHTVAHPWAVGRVIDLGLPHRLVTVPDVATLADLRGRRIAVDSARSGFVTLLRVILAEAGLADAVEFVEVGALQQRLEALRAADVDACLLGAEQLARARAEGARELLALNDRFPAYPGLVVSWLPDPDRADVLARYTAVLAECAARCLDPQADSEVRDAVRTVLELTDEDADAWLAAERQRCTGLAGGDQRAILTDAWRASGRLGPDQPVPAGWYRAATSAARSATDS